MSALGGEVMGTGELICIAGAFGNGASRDGDLPRRAGWLGGGGGDTRLPCFNRGGCWRFGGDVFEDERDSLRCSGIVASLPCGDLERMRSGAVGRACAPIGFAGVGMALDGVNHAVCALPSST